MASADTCYKLKELLETLLNNSILKVETIKIILSLSLGVDGDNTAYNKTSSDIK